MNSTVAGVFHKILLEMIVSSKCIWISPKDGYHYGAYRETDWKAEVFILKTSETTWEIVICIYLPDDDTQQETFVVDINTVFETLECYYDPTGKGQRTVYVPLSDESTIIQRFLMFVAANRSSSPHPIY
ncbi:hypothetical protein [Brevibacillus choshinensis]|uniref:Uncharacterized protein n=1 Tax=Brevibacillus choshinensis TaxID=54911 RepID=A0ABX7FRU7_BRECH|nr:hypothetical protein [Brevibacillus choshinensis]QRG67720.1 hypothetical protein JNE38_00295 [Brevibacillus choshinensis]